MVTPEKIKKGLECSSGKQFACHVCAYANTLECYAHVAADALAYIHQLETKLAEHEKPLEPMMIHEAAGTNEAVWLEQQNGQMFVCDLVYSDMGDDLLEAYVLGRHKAGLWPGRYYNKGWRCWSRRPTDEERKAAKWDD